MIAIKVNYKNLIKLSIQQMSPFFRHKFMKPSFVYMLAQLWRNWCNLKQPTALLQNWQNNLKHVLQYDKDSEGEGEKWTE